MGKEELKRIKEIFANENINVQYLKHKLVITSEDAAKQRGVELKQGVKAILFIDDKLNWVIVNIPADKKVDVKRVASFLGRSKNKIRMAKPEEILEKTGCEIGAVPPFGHKQQIKILIDKGIYDNKENAFNIGLRTHSVKIKTNSLKKIFEKIGALEGEFT